MPPSFQPDPTEVHPEDLGRCPRSWFCCLARRVCPAGVPAAEPGPPLAGLQGLSTGSYTGPGEPHCLSLRPLLLVSPLGWGTALLEHENGRHAGGKWGPVPQSPSPRSAGRRLARRQWGGRKWGALLSILGLFPEQLPCWHPMVPAVPLEGEELAQPPRQNRGPCHPQSASGHHPKPHPI